MPTPEELDARIAELEASSRWRDVVRALEERAEIGTHDSRVSALLRLMSLSLDVFHNQAMAMRAAEDILALAPAHSQAVAFLRDAYQKRRNHKALAELEARLADHTRGPYR